MQPALPGWYELPSYPDLVIVSNVAFTTALLLLTQCSHDLYAVTAVLISNTGMHDCQP